MDAERVSRDMLADDLIVLWLTEGELNRLRFDASLIGAWAPDKYPAVAEFLEATDDV